jgi:hypothetical protein
MSIRPRSLSTPPTLRTRLDALRSNLADVAFGLERRGRIDAADAVMEISARIDALCAEDDAATTPPPSRSPALPSLPSS